MNQKIKPRKWGWLVLFTSTSTLLCCALPTLFVSLGMGMAVASIAANAPLLIKLSMYKNWVFAFSGLLLLVSGWLLYRRGRYCPTDPELSKICEYTNVWNRRLYWCSVIIWLIGFFFAFLAVYIFY